MSFPAHVSTWRTAIQIAIWRHGWAWPLAAAAAALAAATHFLVVDPGRAELARARTELARTSMAAQRPTPIRAVGEQQDLHKLQAVLQQSPPSSELVRTMASLARAEQIVLAQSEYQQQFHSATQVTQLLVTQPVRGTYSQLRHYIESVLRTIPNASLEQIAARRDSVGQSQLEARLRWSVWIRNPPVSSGKLPANDAATTSMPARSPVLAIQDGAAAASHDWRSKESAAAASLLPLISRNELIPAAEGSKHSRGRDLFAVRSWTPPPATAAASAPTAPPLPFSFLGKKLEGEAWEVYLGRGELTHIAREGQVLDNSYRIDKIEPPGLVLTYLPLGQTQTLSIGDPR
jgi:hypothetical protein